MTRPMLQRCPEVASFEDFGDEVVVIHHESGVFYSLKGRAVAVWRALEGGVDAACYESEVAQLEPAEAVVLRALRDDLLACGILAVSSGEGAPLGLASVGALGTARFESNSDFDDLIRLDPIHDVGDAGWPTRRDDRA